jgi:hypothetical protein
MAIHTRTYCKDAGSVTDSAKQNRTKPPDSSNYRLQTFQRIGVNQSGLAIPASSKDCLRSVIGCRVDTNRNPHEKTFGDIRWVEVDKVGEGIVRVVSLVRRPHVIVVADNSLCVGIVRVGRFNSRAKRLVEEELALGSISIGISRVSAQLTIWLISPPTMVLFGRTV